MSKVFEDPDGFVTVSKKKSFKGSTKTTNIPNKLAFTDRKDLPIDINKARACILTCLQDIHSPYFETVFKSINISFPPPRRKVDLVSFGLGHIGDCIASRYQLAFLIFLRDAFNATRVSVHDPLFFKDEITILKEFNLNVIEENTEGCYPIEEDCDLTIIYLPHCPIALTNNFLWSNWSSNLNKCVLICNSFTSVLDSHLNKDLITTYPYFHKISQYTDEFVPENNFKFNDIFNNISIHTFPINKLKKLPEEFWQKESERPKYRTAHEDFITAELIDKLHIT